MTDLFLLLKDDYSLRKSYEIPTGDRAINYITVELEENSDIASHISDYTFTLIIKLPSGKKAAYALTPDEDNKFEKLAVPTAFSFFGEGTKVFIDIYNGSELVAQSDELSYVLQNVDKVVPTLLITENGIYDVTKYDKVNCDVIDPVNELNDGFEKTLVGSDDSGYEAQNPLSENIPQAISDFADIKTAIIAKGVTVPANTPTSDYDSLISSIPAGDDSALKAVIERPSGAQIQIVIPNGTAKISDYIFYNFSGLSGVTIPSSVTQIGNYAFYCTGLTSVTIPNSVTQIGENAFNSTGITSLTVSDNVNSIGGSAFRQCNQLVTASVNAKTIGTLAFNLCSSLTTLILGSNVEQLGDRIAFSCANLTTVTIPNSLRTIQVNIGTTFGYCGNLEYVTIENGFNANDLHLENSTKYSASTIVSWLNALADRTGLSAYTLTMGSTNLAKLTAQEIAIATNKNWNLA